MKQTVLIFGILFFCKVGYTQSDFEKIVGQTIYLKNGKSIKTELFELKFIGQIKESKKSSYLILSGRPCDPCDANISIFIHSTSDGNLTLNNNSPFYSFPGKIKYYEDNSVISESKAFYGEVLPGRYGVIWFQSDLNDQNKWVKTVFFAEIMDGKLVENRKNESLSSTLEQVKNKKAIEIDGIEQTSEP